MRSSLDHELHRQQHYETTRYINKHFISASKLFKVGRFLLKDGLLVKKPRNAAKKNKYYHFFLFNDVLVYATKAFIGRFRVRRQIPIDLAFAFRKLPVQENNKTGSDEHRILICSSHQSFVICCPTEAEQAAWLKQLKVVVDHVCMMGGGLHGNRCASSTVQHD